MSNQPPCDHMGCVVKTHFGASTGDCTRCGQSFILPHYPPQWIEAKSCIRPTAEAADAFWKYWRENGETHKHGYYESTWGAINAALNSTGQLDARQPQKGEK